MGIVETEGQEPGAAGADRITIPETITEVVLRWLGRPRWLWIVAWSSLALVAPFVYSSAIPLSGARPLRSDAFVDLLTRQAALAYVVFVLLVGGLALARQARDLRRDLEAVRGDQIPPDLFAAIGSKPVPMLLTAAVVAVLVAEGWTRFGPAGPIASLPLLAMYMLPILTYVWVDLVILFDLHRLGGQRLELPGFPEDRSQGLERLGTLASTGLGVLLIAAIPIFVAGSDEPLTFGISLVIVGGLVGAFVLSMWRLHRQMAAAKARHLRAARALYADAYRPIASDPNPATLAAHASALGVAQSLEERAQALLTWPVNEGALRFLAVVVTGVLTSIVVRAVLALVEG